MSRDRGRKRTRERADDPGTEATDDPGTEAAHDPEMEAGTDGRVPSALWVLVPNRAARGMAPYVGFAAGVYLAAAFLGAAAGVGRGESLVFPVREGEPAMGAFGPWDFFAHNLPIALLMALGFLGFGLPTLYLLAFNGFTFGSVLSEAVGNFGAVTTVVAILPHAVFELPGIWLGAAVGFRWIHVVWGIAEGDLERPLSAHVRETAVALVATVVLVGVAAWVEATVTPLLLELVTATAPPVPRPG